MSALEVVTDPAWNEGVLLIGLIPVVMIVLVVLQSLALRYAARHDQRVRAGDRS